MSVVKVLENIRFRGYTEGEISVTSSAVFSHMWVGGPGRIYVTSLEVSGGGEVSCYASSSVGWSENIYPIVSGIIDFNLPPCAIYFQFDSGSGSIDCGSITIESFT